MDQTTAFGQAYLCPMHPDIRRDGAASCPKCGMDLVPEGTRFALLRHMIASPKHIAVMATVMAVVMVAAMMVTGP